MSTWSRAPVAHVRCCLAPAMREASHAYLIECRRGEHVFHRQLSHREPLRIRVARHGLERLAVGLDAIGPEVRTHDCLCGLYFADEPRQHDLERGNLVKLLL